MGNTTSKGDNDVPMSRIYAVSDVHIDNPANWRYFEELDYSCFSTEYDVLLVAGDVATALTCIEKFLQLMKSKFRYVFFVPGNHDLWCENHSQTSMKKLETILRLCDDLGVNWRPTFIKETKTLVVPLLGWHDCDFAGGADAKFYESLKGKWNDYNYCVWPEDLNSTQSHEKGVCQFFLSMNNREMDLFKAASPDTKPDHVISLSHFLPRYELLGNVSSLIHQTLPYVVGCNGLDDQLRAAGSTCHVFGHTHIDWNSTIKGVIYVQNPFGYPKEQSSIWKKAIALTNPYNPYLVKQVPVLNEYLVDPN